MGNQNWFENKYFTTEGNQNYSLFVNIDGVQMKLNKIRFLLFYSVGERGYNRTLKINSINHNFEPKKLKNESKSPYCCMHQKWSRYINLIERVQTDNLIERVQTDNLIERVQTDKVIMGFTHGNIFTHKFIYIIVLYWLAVDEHFYYKKG